MFMTEIKSLFTREKISGALRSLLLLTVSFAVIYGFLLLGDLLSRWIPFPRSLLAMLLLFLTLELRIIRLEWLQPSGRLILTYMALFFIPPAVGIVEYGDLVMNNLGIIALNVFLGIFLIIAVVGHTFQFINARSERK